MRIMSGLWWISTFGLLTLLLAAHSARGQSGPAQLPKVLPEAEEAALALSAAPEHLQAQARVYVLTATGYKKVREGTNGFTCLVYRDHPLAQKPTCWDPEGGETIVPRVLFEGELTMQGLPRAEVLRRVEEGFRSGRFVSPRRPGMAYMLSPHILNFNPSAGKAVPFSPHVMFYAPNLTNKELGITPESFANYEHHPFVAYQGPHGYLIVLVNKKK